MPELMVRRCEDRDLDAFFRVLSLTYNDGVDLPPERRQSPTHAAYVAVAGGDVVGVLTVLDMTATRGAGLMRCGGVAAVAVYPELRRTGFGSEMMRKSLEVLRDDGYTLSSLYAFRETWYRKFGYEVSGQRVQIQCPTHRLPSVESGIPIRRLAPDDWRQIEPCHRAFAHARSGVHIRSEVMWKRFLAESKPNAIYAAGDPVEGYVAISHQVAFWENQNLTEVVWCSERGYRACLEALRMLGINKSSMTWFEPSDSPFLARYLDEGVVTKLARPIMFRVHDLPGAVASLRPDGEGTFAVEVRDDGLTDQHGTWTITFGGGRAQASRGGEAGMAMDVRQFVQALLGEPSLDDLVRIGLVEVRDREALAAARRLLPASPTICGDFF